MFRTLIFNHLHVHIEKHVRKFEIGEKKREIQLTHRTKVENISQNLPKKLGELGSLRKIKHFCLNNFV